MDITSPSIDMGRKLKLPAVLQSARLLDRSVGYRGNDGHITFDEAMHLEELRDTLRDIDNKMDRYDIQRKPSTCHIAWKGGQAGDGAHTFQTIGPQGLGETLRFSRQGFQSFTQKVLPARGRAFLEALSDRCGEAGDKVAQVNMSLFMRAADDKPYRIRTANLPQEDGTWKRTVRGVVSTDYGDVPDRSVVDALLDTPEFRNLPVLRADITDTAMRIRLALDGNVERGVRLPMLEAWNSEVGLRAVTLRPGQFTADCLNGLHTVSFSGKGRYRWTHRGDPDRIVQGFRDAVDEATAEARGVMDLYDQALDTRIDNIVAFLDQELSDLLPQKQIRSVTAALNDPTTTPGNTLASAIDAVTLVAQSGDLWATDNLEQAAGRMLGRGLSQAHAGLIAVKEVAEAK
jgi:hypothetical protein